jgi:hypothetical protein
MSPTSCPATAQGAPDSGPDLRCCRSWGFTAARKTPRASAGAPPSTHPWLSGLSDSGSILILELWESDRLNLRVFCTAVNQGISEVGRKRLEMKL